MSVTKARVGRGTTLTEKSTGSHVAIAEMVKITPPKKDTGKAEATHLTSPYNAKEWIPQGYIDYGEITFMGNYISSEAARMTTILESQVATEWKFNVPDNLVAGSGTGSIDTYQAFLKDFQPIDEASSDQSKPMQYSATIVITGKPSFAQAT